MKNILFPTDFSSTADNAFIYALELARHLNGRLTILHTFEIPIIANLGVEDPQVVEQVFQNVELSHFEKYKDQAARLRIMADTAGLGDIELSFLFEEGDLIFNVLEVSKKEGIDLIVMGTTGVSGFERKFFGSNTINVIKSVNVPILAVPYFAQYKGVDKIGFTTIFKESDRNPLTEILRIAKAFEAKVRCFHVARDAEDVTIELHIREWKRDYNDTRLKFIVEPLKETSIEQHISDFVKDHNISMLAIVKRNRTFFERLFGSSLSQKLASKPELPLLVIKEDKS